ncbi:MAG: exo-alpha-sialidase [Gemmatimonadales bacterium]|nr:MAG: exo-alpha-sialidase [Gemmatimonadales bacterium]
MPVVTFVSSAACLFGCGDGGDAVSSVETPPMPGPFTEIASPAGLGSETPHLSLGTDGPTLSWLEPASEGDGETYALRFSTLSGESWADPLTVVERSDLFVNWADFPSVIDLGDDRLAAHWLQYNGAGTYAYQVRLSFSPDRGVSWSDGLVPHEAVTETEHGFVSLVPAGYEVEMFWLDGRFYADGLDSAAMSLRHVTVTDDGTGGEESILDARTCDCCQTSVASIPGGLIAAYRGRTTGEIRDIHVVRRLDGTWQEPALVHADGWHITACPVNGPEIVSAVSDVGIAWFTAATDSGRVYAALSDDAGETFGSRIRIDEGRPIGRVGALALPGGRMFVSWLEAAGDGYGAEVRARIIDRSGRMSSSVPVGTSSVARASGFPVLTLDGERVVVAWTDPYENRVRIAVGQAED